MYCFYFLFALTVTEASAFIIFITNLKDLRRSSSNIRHEQAPHRAIVPDIYYETYDPDQSETIEYSEYKMNDEADFRTKDFLDNEQVDILVKRIKQKLIEELNLKPIEGQGVFKFQNEQQSKKYKQIDEIPKKPVRDRLIRVQESNKNYIDKRTDLNTYSATKDWDQFKKSVGFNMADRHKETDDKQQNIVKKRLPSLANAQIMSKSKKVKSKSVIGGSRPIKYNMKKVLIQTTEENPIFEGVELKYKNDSYEDYVIPKKEENYDEHPINNIRNKLIKPAYLNKVKLVSPEPDENFYERPDNNIKDTLLKPFSNKVKISPHRQVKADADDEITTKNPARITPAKPFKNPVHKDIVSKQNDKDDIFDYEEKMPDEETSTVVTKHVEKARTESLLFYEDNNEKVNYNQNIPDMNPDDDPNIENNLNRGNSVVETTTRYNKGINTMIPTRERYTLSTPNYYEQLPRIAEKYDFKEPIPERDRMPMVIKQIGPKPEIINGNVRV